MLYISLFGHLSLVSNVTLWQFTARPKTLPLWAYLLLNRSRPTPRDALAFLLWPDISETNARSDLRRHIHDLERALPPQDADQPWILRSGDTLQWNPDAGYWLDVAEFEKLSASPQHLAKAVTLYSGDLLPELYDDWLSAERERLRQLYLTSLRRLVAHSSAEGNVEQAIAYARQALNHDPLLEDVTRDMMRLHYQSGRRTEALQAYQALKQNLDDDLEVNPGEETLALYDVIIHDAPMPAPKSAEPVRESPRHNLPAPVTTFVERDREIEVLHNLLISASSPVRLITLVGPPGTGKTRLALETCRRLLDRQSSSFPDGMFFVDLSAITEVEQVPPAIIATLGVKQSADQTLVESLKAHLRGAYALVILDNFEQVIDAGPAISELLTAAPQLRIIITSRTALRLYGEQEFPVPPLNFPERGDLPEISKLREFGAISLYEVRARQRQPGFGIDAGNGQDVAEICRELDGLPLAIELAASQVQTFSPADMVQQMNSRLALLTSDLRDIPEKHITLRAAIAWSYDLLGDNEKRLFRQLSVFAGGWSPEAAAAVCNPLTAMHMDDRLLLLEERNLIQRIEGEGYMRWRMLATIREFGLDQLSSDPASQDVYQRHADYFALLVENIEKKWYGDQIDGLIAQLRLEEDNLRAALSWSLPETATDAETSLSEQALVGVKLAMGLNHYWKIRGRLDEGRAWLTRAMSHRQYLTPELQVSLIKRLASYLQRQGDYEATRTILEDALELSQLCENPLLIGKVLHDLGTLAGVQADYLQAERILVESVAFQKEASDGAMVSSIAYTLNNLAMVYKYQNEFARATSVLQEVLAFHRANNADIEIAATLTNLGNLAVVQKDYDTARTYYAEALQLLFTLDDQIDLCDLFLGMAELVLAQGEPERSARLYGFSQILMKKSNYKPPVQDQERLERDKSTLAACLGQAQLDSLLSEGAAMTLAEAVAFAMAD